MSAYGSRTAALALSSILLAGLAGTAVHAALPGAPAPEAPVTVSAGSGTPVSSESSEEPAPARTAGSGSTCRTAVERSRVVAYCHNPYPEVDLVRLHTECVRWWDIDADGGQVTVGPAETVRLSGRCWKEVAGAWVSHERAPDGPSDAPLPGAGTLSRARTP
ncbi:hypothetical protein ACH4SP_18945 [Streptomyces sp. NPDC021093]|uniref:hypothetical protein n=1 Tax=Streptomyces sp. NPDC021093 TaxID=3365112 RepID=UPI003790875C